MTDDDGGVLLPESAADFPFAADRATALEQLTAFLPNAGSHYANTRNADHGPARRGNVSRLSPAVRHRLIDEDEIVRAVLARHAYSSAEKFIQEVCWRTYWKGWLELRPGVWTMYRQSLDEQFAALGERDGGARIDRSLRRRWQAAIDATLASAVSMPGCRSCGPPATCTTTPGCGLPRSGSSR